MRNFLICEIIYRSLVGMSVNKSGEVTSYNIRKYCYGDLLMVGVSNILTIQQRY